MGTLTRKEIDTLVDALEAWEAKDFGGELIFSLFGAMLCKDDPESKAKMEAEEKTRRDKMETERRERKETSLMLKAKLIGLKQNMLVDDANKILAE